MEHITDYKLRFQVAWERGKWLRSIPTLVLV